MQEGGASQHSTAGSHSPQLPSKVLADSARTSSCTRSSSGKSKKRERPDHNASINKKEQCSEEYESPQKRECLVKCADFGFSTDKDGGLPNLSAVDQLILVMQQEQSSSRRSTLAGIIVATLRDDCLQQFVQLGGLSFLDDWLQDGHKTKSGDGSSKDADKAMDEVIGVILEALRRLPINLEALKGCSIGKSVNHLRSHRNLEIQKKARKLVDIWKKRVDFEMKNSSTSIRASDRSHLLDSVACSVDLPAKAAEVTAVMMMPAELNSVAFSSEATVTAGGESFISTTSNASASQNCTAAKPSEKSSMPYEKDGENNMAYPCSSSITSVSIHSPTTEGENDEHSAATVTPMDHKKEISSSLECRKAEGKDLKCGSNTNKNEPNRHEGCATGVTVNERTNEYRKKLRSGSSSVVHCSPDLRINAAPSCEVLTRNDLDKKTTAFSMENAKSTDIGMNDSQQHHVAVTKESTATKCYSQELSARTGNLSQDSSCLRIIDVCNRQEIAEICVMDGKTDCVNELCISSQSSCSDKQSGTYPMVTLKATGGVGIEMTKKSCENSQDFELQGSDSKSTGDAEIGTQSKLLQEHVCASLEVKVVLSCHSRKDMSTKEDLSDNCEAELDHPYATTGTVISERTGMVVTLQDAVAAVDHEESCLSDHKEADKAHSESDQDPPSNITVNTQKDAGLLDETTHSKSPRSSMNACQAAVNKKAVLSSLHSNSRDVSNDDEQVSLSSGNHSKADDSCQPSSSACEHADCKLKAMGTSAAILSDAHQPPVNTVVSVRTNFHHDFDLNEGLAVDEFSQNSSLPCVTPLANGLTGSTKPLSTLSAPVAVTAATKGAFIPPSNSSLSKCDGWKGSAATSAFRPAEPRNVLAKIQTTPDKKEPSKNQVRNVNNFDLNVADQGTSEYYQNKAWPALSGPPSGQHQREADLDLNRSGENVETEIPTTSILETAMQLPSEKSQKFLARAIVHDFDLNEGPDELQQEQVVHPTTATRSNTSTISSVPFGGPNGPATSGDVAIWQSACTSFPVVTVNMARSELSCIDSMNQPTVGLTHSSTVIHPPPSSSVMYSQATPFFGCTPIPFPASFTYNPISAAPDSHFVVPKMGTSNTVSSQGSRSRANTPATRPPYVMNIDDLRGANGFYTWGRSDQNIYSSTGPTIVNYNYKDVGVSGKEHTVNLDGGASLDQMQLFQQAAVPMTSLKRKDSDYIYGLKQSTWN